MFNHNYFSGKSYFLDIKSFENVAQKGYSREELTMTLVDKGKTRKQNKKIEKRSECGIFDNIACPSSILMYESVTPANCLKGEHERRGVEERKGGDGWLCQWMACSGASLFSFMRCQCAKTSFMVPWSDSPIVMKHIPACCGQCLTKWR